MPQSGAGAGRYVANSFLFLTVTGLIAFGLLVLGAPAVARWMSNPALERYLWWTGLYLCLMMMSACFEIVLIAQGKFLWASVTYAGSDLARAAALIIPVILFRQLDTMLMGAVIVAALRVIASVLYYRSAFGETLVPDRGLLRKQLIYALPFGAKRSFWKLFTAVFSRLIRRVFFFQPGYIRHLCSRLPADSPG